MVSRISFRFSFVLVTICLSGVSTAAHEKESEIDAKSERLLASIAKEWHYPNTDSDVGGGTFSVRTSIQRCNDNYETVWMHYVRKCGFDFKYKETKFYRHTRRDDGSVFVWDDRHRFVNKAPQRIQTFFVCNARDYSVMGILNPTDGKTPPIIHMTITVRRSADINAPSVVDDIEAAGDSTPRACP